MGRDKAKKPKKQKNYQKVGLAASLSAYDSTQLWGLLTAAGASPALRQHWVSIAELVHRFTKLSSSGSKDVAPGLITDLIATARAENADIARNEDYLPADPRKDVRVRLGSSTVRLFPGCVERPVADVDRAHLLASVVDEELIAKRGFGITHLLQVVLGYADFAIQRFDSAWAANADDDGGKASLSTAEVEVARALVESGTPSELEATEELRRALDWLTCDEAELDYELGHPQSCFGRYVRYRRTTGEAPLWLPLAFLPEALGFAVGELAESVSSEPAVRRDFAQSVAADVRRQLWRFTDELIGSPDVEGKPAVTPANVVQWVLPVGEDLAVPVQVMAELDPHRLEFADDPAALKAAKSCTGGNFEIPLPLGKLKVPGTTLLVPLLVVATAHHVATPQAPGIATMSLEDLRWISTSADHEHDLLNFCRDLIREDLPQMFGFETINYWEWWRANGKSFFSGGKAPSFMSLEPHWGEEEWLRAASWTPIEESLATLSLPALRETAGPGRIREGGPTEVYRWVALTRPLGSSFVKAPVGSSHDRPAIQGWSVHLSSIPVAISSADEDWTNQEHRQLLNNLAGSLAFGLRGVDAAWLAAHVGSGIGGHMVKLRVTDRDDQNDRFLRPSEVSVQDCGGTRIAHSTIDVSFEKFLEVGNNHPEAIRGEMARAVDELLVRCQVPEEQAAAVADAWLEAKPTMTLNVVNTPTTRNLLRSPVSVDPAHLSTVHRLAAEGVHQKGVEPGLYSGEAAKALDRDVLAGVALGLLEERLNPYAAEHLVLFGMEQLERSVDHYNRRLRDISESARTLDLDWDPIELTTRTLSESITIRRCNEIAVEAALRFKPAGSSNLDDVAWGEILAAANAYLEATMRSENVHHQVTPSAIRISDSFEITIERHAKDLDGQADEPPIYDMDVESYSEALARQRLSENSWQETEPDAKFQAAVEKQMTDAFGASSQDIYTTLYSLAHWDLEEAAVDVARATRQQLIDKVAELSTLGNEPDGAVRISASLDMLTSFQEVFQRDEWRPWHARTRKHRLLVRPLPLMGSDEYVVAPHYLLAALGVYKQYLDQGQLPWSQPAPPTALDTALARFRAAKNTALEMDVAELLRQRGWNVEHNIKETKAKRLNLPSLATEIDVVAGRPGDRIIWLLEAKDPVSVHATPEVRRHLDTFFQDGKKRSYAGQLKRKFDDLAPHAALVAAALKLPERDPSDAYEVRAAFVTRQAVPAAFIASDFPFFTVAELLQELS